MEPKIDISAERRETIAGLLNVLIADEYVLYTKSRNYHWNVTGPMFRDLHKLFEEQYEGLNDIIDEIAERTRALGAWPLSTLAEFLKHTKLKEHPRKVFAAHEMIQDLLQDHESIIRSLREASDLCTEKLGDAGTADMCTGWMEYHEKAAWMLRSHLEGERV